ncbi:MAG: NTE family protein [Flavobacteriales bacterium]|jgi:NTE family protein
MTQSNSTRTSSLPSIGLALGGGGVKGLAHIGLLKLLDKYELKCQRIAGTSMGAIIGALYAHGLSGADIEERVRSHLFKKGEPFKDMLKRRHKLFRWAKVLRFDKNKGALFAANGLFEHLFDELRDINFDELECTFTAIATDYESGKESVLQQGPLLPAILASMAVPGVFSPQRIDGRLLLDGGLVNNLPCNHIVDGTDIRLASDVISLAKTPEPSAIQALSAALSIMLQRSTAITLEQCPPDLVFRVDTDGLEAFDFHKIDAVLQRGDEAAAAFEEKLIRLLQLEPR